MKTRVYISVLIMLLAVSTACRKEAAEVVQENVPMAFEASVPKSRVPLVNGPEDIRARGLSLFSILTRPGEGSAVILDKAKLQYDSGEDGWSYSPERFWFYGEYDFVALYPYIEGLTAGGGSMLPMAGRGRMEVTSDLVFRATECTFDRYTNDVLYASAKRVQTAGIPMDVTPVPLVLRHTSSAVGFRLRNTTGTDIVEVTGMRLYGLLHRGDLTVTPTLDGGDILWEPDDHRVAVSEAAPNYTYTDECIFDDGKLETGAEHYHDMLSNGGYFVVMPQRVAGQAVTFSFNYKFAGGSTYNTANANVSGVAAVTTWEPGKRYMYDITITNDDILMEIHIVDWREDDVELE